ncbi:hypothetical protein VCUG_00445 [Vavraia culicis subsp. floridensis]|uniref:Uncharacterized protein n=1 Tax=Vavraia culicis (isolate floridensis) TaxID=948595 RepID=L2GXE3_VAVCU|nr:uncharacterized protein VCUG_00445 [Vavraia culicis subsp. floridensis]ELA48022.1 hypothetical protein VCUG_00445 [Vavraia culicis subsp. floridensis]
MMDAKRVLGLQCKAISTPRKTQWLCVKVEEYYRGLFSLNNTVKNGTWCMDKSKSCVKMAEQTYLFFKLPLFKKSTHLKIVRFIHKSLKYVCNAVNAYWFAQPCILRQIYYPHKDCIALIDSSPVPKNKHMFLVLNRYVKSKTQIILQPFSV